MKDYNIVVQVRCESKPEQWIVDCIYEQLNQKINEDILYWQVNPDLNHELCIEIIKKIDLICPEESPHQETQTEQK